MTDKKQEPNQTTPKGLEIPVPKREDVLDALAKVAKPPAVVVTEACITCPECGFSKMETMQMDACQHFYRCDNCGELLKPIPGDCCVFCSYADSLCPPKQLAAS